MHEDKYDELIRNDKMYTNGNFNLARPKEVRTLRFVLPQIYNPVTNMNSAIVQPHFHPLCLLSYTKINGGFEPKIGKRLKASHPIFSA